MSALFEIDVTPVTSEHNHYPLTPRTVDLEVALTHKIGDKYGTGMIPGVVGPCVIRGCECLGVRHRRKENMVTMTALVADLDHLTDARYEEVFDLLEASSYAFVLAETHSHGVEPGPLKETPPRRIPKANENCARVWFPFEAPVSLLGVDWKVSSRGLLALLGLKDSDGACSDSPHLFFDSRHPEGEKRDVWVHDGVRLPPDWVAGALKYMEDRQVAHYAARPEDISDVVYASPEPLDLEDVKRRLASVKHGRSGEAHKRVIAGQAVAAHDAPNAEGDKRRKIYRALGAAWGWRLQPTVATLQLCEGLLASSWREDCALDVAKRKAAGDNTSADDATHLWLNLVKEIHEGREFAEQGKAADKLKNDAQTSSMLEAFDRMTQAASARELVAPEGASPAEVALLEAYDDSHDDTGRTSLIALRPDKGLVYTSREAAMEAITGAAERPAVLLLGGRRVVAQWHEIDSDLIKGRVFSPVSVGDFVDSIDQVTYQPEPPKGRTDGGKPVPASKEWLRWSTPRYSSVVCISPRKAAPVHALNLWRGFQVRPAQGDVRPMLDLLERLAGVDNPDFIVDCWAWKARNPTSLPKVGQVFKGPEGTGKSFHGETILMAFGEHGRFVSTPVELTGRFNADRAGNCVLLASEVACADHAAAGVLKNLITEAVCTLEEKNQKRFSMKNTLALMMLTNDDHALEVNKDSRRWVIYDTAQSQFPPGSPEYNDYWRAMRRWRNEGGVSWWLHYLLTKPLPKDFAPWSHRPVTKGLLREAEITAKMSGATAVWVAEVLECGGVTVKGERLPIKPEGSFFPTATLWDAYLEWCKSPVSKGRTPTVHSPEYLARALDDILGAGARRRTTIGGFKHRGFTLMPAPEPLE